jgi:hypothetical protein
MGTVFPRLNQTYGEEDIAFSTKRKNDQPLGLVVSVSDY